MRMHPAVVDELTVDDDGIVLTAIGSLVSEHREVTSIGRRVHRVPWSRLECVEAADPWPELRLGYRGPFDERLEAFGARLAAAESERFARRVEEIHRLVPTRAPKAIVVAGWLAAPDIEWETIDRIPEEVSVPAEGAYRSGTAPPAEPIRARRLQRGRLDALYDWASSHEGFPFQAQPVEVAVTDRDVYARFRDRRVARVPLARLRTSLRGRRRELVYVFGRRTRLLLQHHAGCPVEALLEAHLQAT